MPSSRHSIWRTPTGPILFEKLLNRLSFLFLQLMKKNLLTTGLSFGIVLFNVASIPVVAYSLKNSVKDNSGEYDLFDLQHQPSTKSNPTIGFSFDSNCLLLKDSSSPLIFCAFQPPLEVPNVVQLEIPRTRVRLSVENRFQSLLQEKELALQNGNVNLVAEVQNKLVRLSEDLFSLAMRLETNVAAEKFVHYELAFNIACYSESEKQSDKILKAWSKQFKISLAKKKLYYYYILRDNMTTQRIDLVYLRHRTIVLGKVVNQYTSLHNDESSLRNLYLQLIIDINNEMFIRRFTIIGDDIHMRGQLQTQDLIKNLVRHQQHLITEHNYDAVGNQLKAVELIAKSSKLALELNQNQIELNRLRPLIKRHREYLVAKDVLSKVPKDPQANLTIGTYLLDKGDSKAGLQHLLNAKNVQLVEMAMRDIKLSEFIAKGNQTELHDLLSTARGWETLLAKSDKEYRSTWGARSANWYKLALPNLTGGEKAHAERQIRIWSKQ